MIIIDIEFNGVIVMMMHHVCMPSINHNSNVDKENYIALNCERRAFNTAITPDRIEINCRTDAIRYQVRGHTLALCLAP